MSESEEAKEASPPTSTPDPASDIVWGGQEIGRVINRTPRQTFHMLESRLLPARKIGHAWCASRSALRQALIGATGCEEIDAE
jgi:hypothetical protein